MASRALADRFRLKLVPGCYTECLKCRTVHHANTWVFVVAEDSPDADGNVTFTDRCERCINFYTIWRQNVIRGEDARTHRRIRPETEGERLLRMTSELLMMDQLQRGVDKAIDDDSYAENGLKRPTLTKIQVPTRRGTPAEG